LAWDGPEKSGFLEIFDLCFFENWGKEGHLWLDYEIYE
jgi:hypothetical protein